MKRSELHQAIGCLVEAGELHLAENLRNQLNVTVTSGMDLKKKKIIYSYAEEIWHNIKNNIKGYDFNDTFNTIFSILMAMNPDSANHNKFKKYFPKKYDKDIILKDNTILCGMGDGEFKTMIKKILK